MIQSNAISEAFKDTFGLSKQSMGFILAMLGIAVFFFNGKKIFALCEGLVPFASVLYIVMSLAVILPLSNRLPSVFKDIFESAFSFRSAGAGALGFLLSKALRYGTIRGLFSNEAGCGTSPIAHATASTDSPVEQGFFGIVEVFIDTMIVCTMTALVILLNFEHAGQYLGNPILMAFSAFSTSLGDFANVILSISVFLFAFATVVCWGYYGKECVYFINKTQTAEKTYYAFYILCIFFGSFISLDLVWELADFAVGGMTLMNLLVVSLMSGEVKKETEEYFKNKRASKRKL
jgi:AGCS family alanine or glycine:cation symporter